MKTKYTASWGMHIAEMIFQTRSKGSYSKCENFGCGSSREQAPSVLKALGIKAVIAKSFARIFYRNSINIGLPVIVCKDLYEHVEDGGQADLDLSAGTVTVDGQVFSCTKLPEYMQNILNAGGLIASLNKEEA